MFETLEARRLLSSVVANFGDGATASLSNDGALTIKGGPGANHLSIREIDGTVYVSDVISTELAIFQGTTSIKIAGDSSDDVIFFQGNSVGATIDGGSGNDEITIFDSSAAGSRVDGGAGSDSILIASSNQTTVVLSSGNDLVKIDFGATGHSDINGGSGDDIIIDQSAGLATYTYTRVETVITV